MLLVFAQIHALFQEKREMKVDMLLFFCMINLMENFPRKSIQLLISYKKNIYSTPILDTFIFFALGKRDYSLTADHTEMLRELWHSVIIVMLKKTKNWSFAKPEVGTRELHSRFSPPCGWFVVLSTNWVHAGYSFDASNCYPRDNLWKYGIW